MSSTLRLWGPDSVPPEGQRQDRTAGGIMGNEGTRWCRSRSKRFPSSVVSTECGSVSRRELAGHQVELLQRWGEVTQQALQSTSADATVPGQIEDLQERRAADGFTCSNTQTTYT